MYSPSKQRASAEEFDGIGFVATEGEGEAVQLQLPMKATSEINGRALNNGIILTKSKKMVELTERFFILLSRSADSTWAVLVDDEFNCCFSLQCKLPHVLLEVDSL